MSGYSLCRTVALTRCVTANATAALCRRNTLNTQQTCGYAKKAAKMKGKGTGKEDLKGPEVCTDMEKLTSYAVGVNIFKQGEDPKLKPTEEYPEWLFQLNLGGPKLLQDLKPDEWQYWKRLRKENIWRNNKLSKGKKM